MPRVLQANAASFDPHVWRGVHLSSSEVRSTRAKYARGSTDGRKTQNGDVQRFPGRFRAIAETAAARGADSHLPFQRRFHGRWPERLHLAGPGKVRVLGGG